MGGSLMGLVANPTGQGVEILCRNGKSGVRHIDSTGSDQQLFSVIKIPAWYSKTRFIHGSLQCLFRDFSGYTVC